MVGFKGIRGKGGDCNVWSRKEMAWGKIKGMGSWRNKKGIEQGIALNRFEVYQTMLDKGFSVKAIASIFSVSEESIKKMLMKV